MTKAKQYFDKTLTKFNARILIILVITFLACDEDEQESTGNVQGIVSSEGIAVDGASIILESTNQTTSDFQGRYSLEDVEAKTYKIMVEKEGYVNINEDLTVLGGQTQTKNFDITKISEPVIYIGAVSDIFQTTATVKGNISFLGAGYSGTIQHGHCWSTNTEPTINDSKTELGTAKSTGEYESEITSLEAKTIYYVRSYIQIGTFVFYSDQVEFKTKPYPPEINDFNPKFGPVGTLVEISGNHFSTISENFVKFGNFIAEIESVSENLLIVKVPYVDKSQKVNISVTTEDMTDISLNLFDIWFPWNKLNNQDSKTLNAASFVAHDNGYVIGANSSNMLKYNPENDLWENNLVLPENSGEKPFAFTSGSRIFIMLANGFWEYTADNWIQKSNFPGSLQTDRRYNFNFSIGTNLYIGNCYKTYEFWSYNILDDTWSRKADFTGNFNTSNPVWGNFTFSLNQKSFLGVSQTAFAINTLWEYNPEQDIWIPRSPIPSNAYDSYASFIIDNVAYLGLGRNFEWGDGYVSNTLWKYDLINDKWDKLQNSPTNMSVYASFAIKNKGYIMPFRTSFDRKIDEVWEFDPSRN